VIEGGVANRVIDGQVVEGNLRLRLHKCRLSPSMAVLARMKRRHVVHASDNSTRPGKAGRDVSTAWLRIAAETLCRVALSTHPRPRKNLRP
jgi:hypothetical protein